MGASRYYSMTLSRSINEVCILISLITQLQVLLLPVVAVSLDEVL